MIAVGAMLLLLGSCRKEDRPAHPTTAPRAASSPATAPARESETLTMALVRSLRVSPANDRHELQRRMMLEWSNLPRDLPARIQSMNVRAQARELALILKDATDYKAEGFSSWKNFEPGEPEELQFSCVTSSDSCEEFWHDLLRCQVGDVPAIAAQVLWTGHTRRHAEDVMEAVADKGHDSAAWKEVRRLVEETFRFDTMITEIVAGDKDWGLWLAAKRPNPEYVPALLAALATAPNGYSAYALGCSGDARALAPLVAQLKAGNYEMSGHAARALGLLGKPEAEGPLIESLAAPLHPWAQASACWALGQIGTWHRKSPPPLGRTYQGARHRGDRPGRGCQRGRGPDQGAAERLEGP
ncbi:MAG: hypothetical protein NTV86_18320 [Planctomycetota bacterium]|nr:hypothetical protein [Planctomycetota bacterium]